MKIYNTARAAPTPALNALATLMLVAAMLTVVAGFLIYRWLSHRAGDRAVDRVVRRRDVGAAAPGTGSVPRDVHCDERAGASGG